MLELELMTNAETEMEVETMTTTLSNDQAIAEAIAEIPEPPTPHAAAIQRLRQAVAAVEAHEQRVAELAEKQREIARQMSELIRRRNKIVTEERRLAGVRRGLVGLRFSAIRAATEAAPAELRSFVRALSAYEGELRAAGDIGWPELTDRLNLIRRSERWAHDALIDEDLDAERVIAQAGRLEERLPGFQKCFRKFNGG